MVKKLNKIIILLALVFVGLFAFACNFTTSSKPNGPNVSVKGQSTVVVGDSFAATATIEPTDKYQQNVTWQTSDGTVATVDNDGIVTALREGRVTILARYEDDNYRVDGRLSVKVVGEDIIYTNDAPASFDIIGEAVAHKGTLTLYRFNTTPSNASQSITWSSNNTEVAKIDDAGVATFIKTGTVTFTVASKINNSIKESITVTVVDPAKNPDSEQAIIECIANTKDSILGVANYVYNSNTKLVKNSIGSGFVYAAWGYLASGEIVYDLNRAGIVKYGYYLITNKHVVSGSDELKIYIHMIDDEVPAELVQCDEKVDLAVVRFDYSEYIKPLEIANSDSLLAGQFVVAIGNPEGFDFSSSATMGIVSHPRRYISDDTDGDGIADWEAAYIQHDSAINPGNSGGPLLNLYGQVVGINTLKFAATEIDNMGFSIPSKDIIDLLPYLEKGKIPARAKIGVTVSAVADLLATDYTNNSSYNYKIPDNCTNGMYVTEVTTGSVAYGKIKADDIILEFNGVKLKKTLQLRAELGAIVVGSNTEILVKVLRNGSIIDVVLVW